MFALSPFKRLRGRNQRLGRAGERLALHELRRDGCSILARNLRNRFGELDVIAEAADGTVVIVEVKAGSNNSAFPAELHVTREKQRRLTALAAQLARRYHLTQRPIRFDVIAVEFPPEAQPLVRHHKNAFPAVV